jgi:hypothetical protein
VLTRASASGKSCTERRPTLTIPPAVFTGHPVADRRAISTAKPPAMTSRSDTDRPGRERPLGRPWERVTELRAGSLTPRYPAPDGLAGTGRAAQDAALLESVAGAARTANPQSVETSQDEMRRSSCLDAPLFSSPSAERRRGRERVVPSSPSSAPSGSCIGESKRGIRWRYLMRQNARLDGADARRDRVADRA